MNTAIDSRPPRPTRPTRRTQVATALALLGIAVAVATATAPAAAADDGGATSRGWLALALLPRVGDVFIAATQQGAGCVFSRLINFLGAGTNPNNPNCASGAAGANYVPPGAQFNAYGNPAWNAAPPPGWQAPGGGYAPAPAPGGGFVPAPAAAGGFVPAAAPVAALASPPPLPPPALTPQTAGVLSTQPLLSFMVQKLVDHAPLSPVVGVLAQDQLHAQGEPSFALNGGEAFAIRFATTVPGRVRLINTDVEGKVSVSSLYEAVPGGDNRMPREHEGGILMTGKPGIEYLDVEFVPCISSSLSQHPAVLPFAGTLPTCSLDTATRGYRPAHAGGGGALADLGGRAMSFPASADPTQPVAIAPAAYAKGETLRFRLRIQHLARP